MTKIVKYLRSKPQTIETEIEDQYRVLIFCSAFLAGQAIPVSNLGIVAVVAVLILPYGFYNLNHKLSIYESQKEREK